MGRRPAGCSRRIQITPEPQRTATAVRVTATTVPGGTGAPPASSGAVAAPAMLRAAGSPAGPGWAGAA